MKLVSLNQQKLRDFFAEAICLRVTSLLNAKKHTNSDGLFSPSQWFVDSAHTVRHTMQTGLFAASAQNRVTLTLTYNVRTV